MSSTSRPTPQSTGPSRSPFAPENSAATPKTGHEPEHFRLGLSMAQVGGGALAAVTSAVAASFFGVGGTIAGAAFGAVVSQVGGAFYQQSLKRAGTKIREAAPTQLLTGAIPRASDQPQVVEGPVTGQVDAPVPDPNATTVFAAVASGEPEDATQVIAASHAEAAPNEVSGTVTDEGADAADATQVLPAAIVAEVEGQDAPAEPAGRGINWKLTAGLVAATFVLAVGGITAYEGLTKETISGDGSGTSIGSFVTGKGSSTTTDDSSDDSTPVTTGTATSTPTVTETATSEPTGTATATSEPTTTVTVTQSPTATATSSSTATSPATSTGGSGADSAPTPTSTSGLDAAARPAS